MKNDNTFINKDMIDLKNIPFSRFGSFFVISSYDENSERKIYIRDVRGGDNSTGKLFYLDFIEDKESIQDYEISCTETLLTIKKNDNKVEIFFQDEDSIRIRGEGINLNLSYLLKRYDNIFSLGRDKWELCSYSKELRILFKKIAGKISVIAPWDKVGNTSIDILLCSDNEPFDIVLESYKVLPKHVKNDNGDFYDNYKLVVEEYENWFKQLPSVPDIYIEKKKLASYITWMNFVKPEGCLKRYAMYMSKNWMTNIWSWDNCFGAIFLASFNPQLSYDQYMMFKEHQHESGVYPDYINDTYASYSCTKPPIYGWCYDYLLKKNSYFYDKERLSEVYDTISKQTKYWLNHRTSSKSLPYYSHGNDSGWDNGTLYDKGIPVITPDLSAFLIYQMDFLSRIANKLDMTKEKEKWTSLADGLTENMIKHLWKDGKFNGYCLANNEYIKDGDSLQLLLPLLIAYRLDDDINKKLLEALSDGERFYGTYGLATEGMNSKFYKENGYWRGPVWAPTMLIFIESLHRMGEAFLAKDLAERFTNAVLIGGMAENFDPKTGEGLVDPAFAWTSSVFLTLIEDYIK